MAKGNLTKKKIIEKAAVLFNSDGYAGASLSNLMESTGLKKGGIYNHFGSKEEILIDAFNYSVNEVRKKLREAIKNKMTPKEQLLGILDFYRDYPMNPVIKGGCPVLNSIIYSDNSKMQFKKNVRNAVDELILVLEFIIKSGIRTGEFKEEVNPHNSAVFIFTAIEGGVAVTRNYEDGRYMKIIIDQLIDYVKKEIVK